MSNPQTSRPNDLLDEFGRSLSAVIDVIAESIERFGPRLGLFEAAQVARRRRAMHRTYHRRQLARRRRTR